MAGPNLTNHDEIGSVQTSTNTTPNTQSINEKAGQTFVKGTPVQLNAGVIQAWDGSTVLVGIAGVTLIDGSNYGSDGQGASGPFTGVGFPGTLTTFGKVPFEASAVNIPHGAPFALGQTLFEEARPETVFRGQFDNAAGNVAADWTPVQSDIGKKYGMTVDASGHWYVDKNKTGANAVLVIRALDPIDGSIANAHVLFSFLDSATQLIF